MFLYGLAAFEVVFWIIGMAAGHPLGGILHLLLVLALLAVGTEMSLRLRQEHYARLDTEADEDDERLSRAA